LGGNILDDPARLQAERAAADREYNDALTRLDHAIQQLPRVWPAPPPPPDDHQLATLNTRWTVAAPPAGAGLRGRVAAIIRRAVAPLFDQQQAFNSALVDHVNRNMTTARETSAAVASTIAALRTQVDELARFQSLLVMFLQQITPYVDTRDRDVAGLLRGLSGAIDTVADELLKRTDTLVANDRRRDLHDVAAGERFAEVDARLAALEASVHDLRRLLARPDVS
jgi:hypothetical protein